MSRESYEASETNFWNQFDHSEPDLPQTYTESAVAADWWLQESVDK